MALSWFQPEEGLRPQNKTSYKVNDSGNDSYWANDPILQIVLRVDFPRSVCTAVYSTALDFCYYARTKRENRFVCWV
jgi:hypothetical protein